MKKSLLVAAILASLGTGAFAQSSVSIYGIMDAGYTRTSDGINKSSNITSGGESGSRLGFKGTEGLGQGLSANFVLESGINIDDGTTGTGISGQQVQNNKVFGRQAWVGLNSNDLGAVKLGLQYTPLRVAVDTIDPFNVGFAGNALKTLGNGNYAERANRAATYSTPSFGGLSGQVEYGVTDNIGSSSTNRTRGAGINYDNGPLTVRFAYDDHNADTFTSSSRDLFLGATYDLGYMKAHAAVADRNVDDNNGLVVDRSARNYLVGVSAPFGASSVMASYIRNDVRHTSSADSDQVAVGYTYNFSPRTNVYGSYARYMNDSNASLNSAANGLNGNQVSAGIRHKF